MSENTDICFFFHGCSKMAADSNLDPKQDVGDSEKTLKQAAEQTKLNKLW